MIKIIFHSVGRRAVWNWHSSQIHSHCGCQATWVGMLVWCTVQWKVTIPLLLVQYCLVFLFVNALWLFASVNLSVNLSLNLFQIHSTARRWLTTAPGSPTTHWYQLRCVLSQPIYVMAGQEITGRMHLIAHTAQSYTIFLTLSGW